MRSKTISIKYILLHKFRALFFGCCKTQQIKYNHYVQSEQEQMSQWAKRTHKEKNKKEVPKGGKWKWIRCLWFRFLSFFLML